MKDLLWYSAILFNNSRTLNGKRRRGSLWNPRFRSCALQGSNALFKCCLYVSLNPVRANMVKKARDYKWSSAGDRQIHGRHPHRNELERFYSQAHDSEYSFDEVDKLFNAHLTSLEKVHELKHKNDYSLNERRFLCINHTWMNAQLVKDSRPVQVLLDELYMLNAQGSG